MPVGNVRYFREAVVLLVLGQLVACQPDQQVELRGSLFFGAGQYLAELELHSGNVNIETSLGDVDIRQISPQSDQRLLVTVFGSVDRHERHSLVLYEFGNRQALTIAYGRNGHYLPGTEVLVYDDGVSIIVAERGDEGWQKTEAVRHAYNAKLAIRPVSATRFLYALGEEAIRVFDIDSRQSVELAALSRSCRLDASLWDPQREQLLCRRNIDDNSFEYAMTGLDGAVTGTLPLPGSRKLQPLAFLPDQDALVLSERWRGRFSDRERHAIWVHRFDSDTSYRLVDDQFIGSSVVYRPR